MRFYQNPWPQRACGDAVGEAAVPTLLGLSSDWTRVRWCMEPWTLAIHAAAARPGI